MVFTPAEIAYLKSQRLGRIATVQSNGSVQNNPVGFWYNDDLDTVEIGGLALAATQKFRNVAANGRVAFVVDDLASVQPWRVRGIEIRGRAEALTGVPAPPERSGMSPELIRIHPARIISWGIDPDQPRMTSRWTDRGRTD